MRKTMYWIILAIVALAGAGYYFFTSATTVELTTVGQGDILQTVVDTGYVQAVDRMDINATQGGRIVSLSVSVGDTVGHDQVIMVLDNRDLSMSTQQLQVGLSQANVAAAVAQAAVEQARLDLETRQADYKRAGELYAAGALSQVDYESAKSLLDKTQANYDAQTKSLQDAQQQVFNYQNLISNSRHKEQELEVRSPIAGTLMQLPVAVGDVVTTGTLLAQVGSAGALEIKVDLLSDDVGEVKIGQLAEVTAPVLGDQVLAGQVVKIYPQAEEKQSALGVIQRRVPTIIRLDSMGNLKPGYETRVTIVTAGKQGILLVPREAVSTAGDGSKQVMQVVNSRVKFQPIKTGLQDSKNVEIVEGLQSGDRIIKDASIALAANARVKPQ